MKIELPTIKEIALAREVGFLPSAFVAGADYAKIAADRWVYRTRQAASDPSTPGYALRIGVRIPNPEECAEIRRALSSYKSAASEGL